MPKFIIDGLPLEAAEGTTILQAAEKAGLRIPHFCSHSNLVSEGTCRMCVVEIEGMPKLELSCSTAVGEGMKIQTRTPRILEARRSVLELLLADHPVDCPICDKAGECRLQEYYLEHGLFPSAFRENKERRKKIIPIGERLLLDRERCILCTRCIRFLREVTKTRELGVFERGVHSEIGIYEGIPVSNPYSGNLADICPVGAITDTTFRFKTRAWFLEPRPSICPFCARGCRIDVDYHPGFARKPETAGIFRVRPRPDATPRGPWICDIGRYGWIPFEKERRTNIGWNKGAAAAEMTWDQGLSLLSAKIRTLIEMKRMDRLLVVLQTGLTNEELSMAKKVFGGFDPGPKIRFADPSDGEDDGFLRTAERTPNRRGALDLGLEIRPVVYSDLCERTEILLAFGSAIADSMTKEELMSAFEAIRTKVLFDSSSGSLDNLFDFVFPCASPFEKSGTYTNIAGLRQEFSAVRPPQSEAKTEGEIIRALAAACGLRETNEDPISGFSPLGPSLKES